MFGSKLGRLHPNRPTVIPCNAIWQRVPKEQLKASPLPAAGSKAQRWSEID